MKAGTARTNVLNLATALHRDALGLELHRTPGWTSRVFKAIVRWPADMLLWQQWETIYTTWPGRATSRRTKVLRAKPRGDGRRGDLALARGETFTR